MVGKVNYLLRTLVLAAFALLAFFGYRTVDEVVQGHVRDLRERDERIESLSVAVAERDASIGRLEEDVADRDARILEQSEHIARLDEQVEQLDTALRYMKVDHRRARLSVVEQRENEDGELETTVSFTELGPDGESLGEPQRVTIPGRMAYLESLVIKFDDSHVEAGDAWRGTSVCLFRRLFSEVQSPEEGVELDPAGEAPLAYTDDTEAEWMERLWLRFWDYANDPAAAAEAGVRAIHGEAPFVELRPGRSYVVELRASGGLSLRAE